MLTDSDGLADLKHDRGNRPKTYYRQAPRCLASPSSRRNRQTCPGVYRIHLGPQVLPIVLGWHESVRWAAAAYLENPHEVPLLTFLLSLYRQPILADEVQSFKALITVHKVLQEGHPIAVREAQANTNWLESLSRGLNGEGLRGTTLLGVLGDLWLVLGGEEDTYYTEQPDHQYRLRASAPGIRVLLAREVGLP